MQWRHWNAFAVEITYSVKKLLVLVSLKGRLKKEEESALTQLYFKKTLNPHNQRPLLHTSDQFAECASETEKAWPFHTTKIFLFRLWHGLAFYGLCCELWKLLTTEKHAASEQHRERLDVDGAVTVTTCCRRRRSSCRCRCRRSPRTRAGSSRSRGRGPCARTGRRGESGTTWSRLHKSVTTVNLRTQQNHGQLHIYKLVITYFTAF
jgi:hypothetical protein